MAYRPILTVDVEHEGAVFTFKSPDAAMSKVVSISQRCMAEGMTAADIDARPPADLLEAYAKVFVDGVISWTGVEGEDSFIACNGGTKRAIPFTDKVAVANLYIARLGELQAAKTAPVEAATSTTPPEAPAGDSKRNTDGPASATPPEAAEPVTAEE